MNHPAKFRGRAQSRGGGAGKRSHQKLKVRRHCIFAMMPAYKKIYLIICCHALFSYTVKANAGKFDTFRHRNVRITICRRKKVVVYAPRLSHI